MAIAVTLIAAVLLTVLVVAVSRAGGRHHQEELNQHGTDQPVEPSSPASPPAQPKADRPAGPGAEDMGVAGAGRPTPDPRSERRS